MASSRGSKGADNHHVAIDGSSNLHGILDTSKAIVESYFCKSTQRLERAVAAELDDLWKSIQQ